MFIIVNLNVTAITGLGNSSRMYSMNKYSVRSTTVSFTHPFLLLADVAKMEIYIRFWRELQREVVFCL